MRYQTRPHEVEARQVPASDPQGSFLKWTRDRRPVIRVLFMAGTDEVAYATIEQLGDFPQHAYPGDYIVFRQDKRALKVRRHEFERDYVRCG